MVKEKRRRLTKDEMESRQDEIYELRLRGISFSVIVSMLKANYPGLDKSMVCRDLQRLRKRIKKSIKEYDPEADVGESVKFFQAIEQRSLLDYTSARGNTKPALLNVALKAREAAIKLKQDFGLMRRMPQEIKLTDDSMIKSLLSNPDAVEAIDKLDRLIERIQEEDKGGPVV